MATITANSAETLLQALSAAKAGTTIKLAGGDYGALSLNAIYDYRWAKFPGEVTIGSADPDDPATFSRISMRGVENLTFEGIAVDYTVPKGVASSAVRHQSAVLVQDSTNVTFRNSEFEGNPASFANGLPVARGLFIRDSKEILVENNEIHGFYRAGVFPNNSDMVLRGNEVHSIRSDGFNFSVARDVLIENNHFHDFVTAAGIGDHRDMIQIWTVNTHTPSAGVTIRNNLLDSGYGPFTQSIFMRNEAVDKQGGGRAMFYQDIVIDNNVIYNGQYHGITIGATDGLTITNNTVLHNPDAGDRGGVSRPRINVAEDSRNVLVEHNIAEAVPVPGGNAVGWKVANNLLVQNRSPDKPNYYDDLFVDALTGGGEADLAALQGVPGGVVKQGGYGSSLMRAPGDDSGPVVSPEKPPEAPEPAPAPGPAPNPDSGVLLRWNAGARTVEALDGGPDWMADAGVVVGAAKLYTGNAAGKLAAAVPDTTPQGVFAQEYFASSAASPMALEFGDGRLEDGTYAVRLYMGNGYAGTDGPGERVFDVSVEGELFLDDLDLSARLGHKVGGMFEWTGQVSDGTIDIDFGHELENPLINAVEIILLDPA